MRVFAYAVVGLTCSGFIPMAVAALLIELSELWGWWVLLVAAYGAYRFCRWCLRW